MPSSCLAMDLLENEVSRLAGIAIKYGDVEGSPTLVF